MGSKPQAVIAAYSETLQKHADMYNVWSATSRAEQFGLDKPALLRRDAVELRRQADVLDAEARRLGQDLYDHPTPAAP